VLLGMKTRAGYSHEHVSIAGCKRAHRAAERLLKAARERHLTSPPRGPAEPRIARRSARRP
jgi:hypothetical protein